MTDAEKLSRAKILNIILGMGFLVATFFFIWSATSWFEKKLPQKMIKTVETPIALEYIQEFRNDLDLRKKTKIIWYDEMDIRDYLDSFFVVWTNKMKDRLPDTTNYRWVVGFYPMRRPDKDWKNRVDFLTIPTIVNKRGEVYDFASDTVRGRYKHKVGTKNWLPGCDTCVAFDAGHLWP